MILAALYLRYSTVLQRDTSLEDQARNCQVWAEKNGFTIVPEFVFEDAAVSGMSVTGRTGLEKLLATICRSTPPVQALLVDDLSRLARDLADSAMIFKQLQFYVVDLISVSDSFRGSASNASIEHGFRSVFAEFTVQDIRRKTHRGLAGQAHRGLSTGGRLFGYRIVPVSDNPKSGKKRVIDETEAEVVRGICEMASEGKSYETILGDLVKRNAPAPNPGKKSARRGWNVSSIRFLLMNPQYYGRVVRNQTQAVKNSFTGKRAFKKRPETEWVITDRAELAIITKPLFETVQKELAKRAAPYTRKANGQLQGRARGTTYSAALLSGMLKCDECGGGMTRVGGKVNPNTGEAYRQYRCVFAKRRGDATCSNHLSVSKKHIEKSVTGTIVRQLLNPECIEFFEAEFRKAFAEEMQKDRDSKTAEKLRSQVAKQEDRVRRLVEFLASGESHAATESLRQEETKLKTLQHELAVLEATRLPFTPPPAKAIRNELERLRATLVGNDPAAAKSTLKNLIGELRLKPVRIEKTVPLKTDSHTDPKKQESRPTWAYQVTGSLFLQNLLVPLSSTEPGGLSVVAGARYRACLRPAPSGACRSGRSCRGEALSL